MWSYPVVASIIRTFASLIPALEHNSLDYLLRFLRSKKPKSIRVCALLDKPSRREVQVPIAYRGFEVPNEFIVGFGLDFAEKSRNLPYVGYFPS